MFVGAMVIKFRFFNQIINNTVRCIPGMPQVLFTDRGLHLPSENVTSEEEVRTVATDRCCAAVVRSYVRRAFKEQWPVRS